MESAPSLKVFVILGHPRSDSYCGALARAYAEGAREAGAEVRSLDLGEMNFALNVVRPSPHTQPFEPDLKSAKESVTWADHLVFIFPTWWATMPALLKGFLDRIILPDFAFRVDESSPTGYRPLLKGRSAEVITTMDSPHWVYRWLYGRPGDRAMKGGILGFCGIRPVKSTYVCRVKHLSEEEREAHIEKAHRLGRRSVPAWQRRCRRHRLMAWIRIVRLQFYAMTLLGYGLGAAAVTHLTTAGFSWTVFLLGFLGLFFLEMGSVLLNEIHDQGTDRLNQNSGPFNGGSRVLVEKNLSPATVRRVSRVVLVLAVFCFGGVILTGDPSQVDPLNVGILLFIGYLLGPGYTVPPLNLVYRGAGELVVGFTHSPFMILCGWVFLGGAIGHPLPWLLSLPMFLAIFAAITLAGIPDAEADAAVRKRTLAVLFSCRIAAWMALLSALAAAAAIPLIAMAGNGIWPLFESVFPFICLHAALLAYLIARYLRSGAPPRRIDGILFTALSFILWFSAGPLVTLITATNH